jgi:hypothetical protein
LAAACRKVSCRATVAWRGRNILRKTLTHGHCESKKKVTAAAVRITRCAGHGRKGRNKEIVIERNRIKRREPRNERSKGIRSRDVEELLHLRKKRKALTTGTQESEHLWEAEDRTRRTYVTFLERKSW